MGSFNIIFYGPKGREGIKRRITLKEAVKRAEAHTRSGVRFAAASVRRVDDGAGVGYATYMHPGQFIFDREYETRSAS